MEPRQVLATRTRRLRLRGRQRAVLVEPSRPQQPASRQPPQPVGDAIGRDAAPRRSGGRHHLALCARRRDVARLAGPTRRAGRPRWCVPTAVGHPPSRRHRRRHRPADPAPATARRAAPGTDLDRHDHVHDRRQRRPSDVHAQPALRRAPDPRARRLRSRRSVVADQLQRAQLRYRSRRTHRSDPRHHGRLSPNRHGTSHRGADGGDRRWTSAACRVDRCRRRLGDGVLT